MQTLYKFCNFCLILSLKLVKSKKGPFLKKTINELIFTDILRHSYSLYFASEFCLLVCLRQTRKELVECLFYNKFIQVSFKMREYSQYTSIDDLEGYRTRDIKKLLLEKLHVPYETVSKILDRRELKELAFELILKQQTIKATQDSFQFAMAMTICLIIVSLLLYFHKRIYWYTYDIRKRCETLRIATKHKLPFIAFLLLIGLVLQFYNHLLQLHTLATWVMPSHILSQFRLPMLSVPLSMQTPSSLLNFRNRSHQFSQSRNDQQSFSNERTYHEQSSSTNRYGASDSHISDNINNNPSSFFNSYIPSSSASSSAAVQF